MTAECSGIPLNTVIFLLGIGAIAAWMFFR